MLTDSEAELQEMLEFLHGKKRVELADSKAHSRRWFAPKCDWNFAATVQTKGWKPGFAAEITKTGVSAGWPWK